MNMYYNNNNNNHNNHNSNIFDINIVLAIT